MSETSAQNVLDPQLLEILRCPLTRSKLRLEGNWLIAEEGGLRYPIRDGIPVMLMEEATLPPDVKSLDELREKYAPKKT
jgi:uncharacterized protein YbaR (Trm112 family)